ncbi:restriction endonuclease subunit S [Pseudoxanthomonas winnipegensis]|uniref:restriction endonuclease subunit S n=1 Tax=Pseudoxanthomonas winnipegensis TaxID=2480810 RepID=UPI002575EF2C|nr:restriction endonuclease subunit S [Pseudoxanthomonas winnipegensis]WJI14339.1 restriction endonuclease subunit S [Pseudoxanthomonas winnipegensis]
MTSFKTLRELVTFRGGGTPSKKIPEYWDGDIPWASVKDFTSTSLSETQDFITQEGLGNSSANLIPKGHVIITTRMSLGKAAINAVDLAINQDLRALIPKVPLDAKFLLHAVLSLKEEIVKKGSGATVKGITQEELYKLEIPVPEEFEDQIRIAHLLGKIEGLIAQRKQHLQQLDDLLKSVFLEMFGDPGRNEKGWDKPELKAFGKISTGNTPPRNDPANYDGDFIEWIKTDNITGDAVFVTPATEHLSEVGAKKARMVSNGALLVACIAGSVESIGRAALTDRTVSFNQQINAIQPGKSVHPLYLYSLFKLSRAYIQSHATKGMKKILTKGDFEKITMIKPPVEIQNQFAVIVEKVEGLKSRYQQSLADFETLYGAVSQQAFKGELDLSRVALLAAPIEGEKPVAAAAPTPIAVPVIELPEADLLPPALQDRAQLAPLLRFWLEAYRTQLGGAAFSIERFFAAAQTRLGELHPDNDFELRASDYEIIKAWVFEALVAGALTQAFDDDRNRIELKAVAEQNLA